MTFGINDYVNYSTAGICLIAEIKEMTFPGSDSPRTYYILKPISNPDSTVFVPTDKATLKSDMRPIPSKEKIDEMIINSGKTELEWENNRKLRESVFHEILKTRNEIDLLRLAKCIYKKQRDQARISKKLCSSDLRTLKTAEKIISEEFAFSLKIDPDEIGNYIRDKLEIQP